MEIDAKNRGKKCEKRFKNAKIAQAVTGFHRTYKELKSLNNTAAYIKGWSFHRTYKELKLLCRDNFVLSLLCFHRTYKELKF